MTNGYIHVEAIDICLLYPYYIPVKMVMFHDVPSVFTKYKTCALIAQDGCLLIVLANAQRHPGRIGIPSWWMYTLDI